MPEDKNAWSAQNRDKICYACGRPYSKPAGIGCYLKGLHRQSFISSPIDQPQQPFSEPRPPPSSALLSESDEEDIPSLGMRKPRVNSGVSQCPVMRRMDGITRQCTKPSGHSGDCEFGFAEYVRTDKQIPPPNTPIAPAIAEKPQETVTHPNVGSPASPPPPPQPPPPKPVYWACDTCGDGLWLDPDLAQRHADRHPGHVTRGFGRDELDMWKKQRPAKRPDFKYEDMKKAEEPPSIPYRRHRFRLRSARRAIRIRWSYFFLAMWAAVFGLGLYLVPTVSLWYLVPLSFANALLVYVFVWGVAGIARRGAGRKAFSVLLILVLIGLAYQNYSALQNTNVRTVGIAYQREVSLVSSALSYLSSLSPSSTSGNSATGPSPSIFTTSQPSQTSAVAAGYPAFNPSNPEFIGGSANISFPQDYTTLVNYALSIINRDRAAFGEPPLTLSTVASAQQHADSMDYFGYFEHTDNQGYTPEERFDMLGGAYGLTGENQGQSYCIGSEDIQSAEVYPVSCSLQTIENGIANSEWGMMYNDAACCNNGHRMNILDTSFTQVSIGVAYNSSSDMVYFVEDFYGPCPAGYTCP